MHEFLARRWNAVSLRTKMTGVSVLLLTFGLLAAGLGSMYVLKSYLTDEVVDAKIDGLFDDLAASNILAIDDSGAEVVCSVAVIPGSEIYIAVLSTDGEVLCSNRAADTTRPTPNQLSETFLDSDDDIFTVPGATRGVQWRAQTVPYTLANSGKFVFVAVGLSLAETDALIARVRSEERRVGKECSAVCRSRWSPYH